MGSAEDAKKAEEGLPKAKGVAYYRLFRYASCLDFVLFALGIFSAAVQGFCLVFMIVIFGEVMDELMLKDDSGTLTMVRWMCLLGCASFVFGWLTFSCTNVVMERQKRKLRLEYLTAVLKQDVGWFDLHEPGTLPEKISANIEQFAMGIGDKAGNLVLNLASVVTGLSLGFYYWWKLSLIVMAIIPFMVLGMAFMGQTMKNLHNENQTWYGKAGACAEEVMRGLRTVVAFRGERKECDRYSGFLRQARRGGVMAQLKVGIGMGYVMAVMLGSYGMAFWASAALVRDGEVDSDGNPYTGGDIMKVFFCILKGGAGLGLLAEPLQAVFAACAAGASVFEVIDKQPAIERTAAGDSGTAISSIESITFEDVHFVYPARPDAKVLNGARLSIAGGQKVAIVGESGSGKSTIVSLLERFYDPTEGRVLVNGLDLRTLSPNSVRSLMGYVGQEPVLFATSIRKNILYGNPSATEAMLEEVQRQAMLDFVKEIEGGMGTFVGSGGSQFSGGQKQRIALARALIKKPSLLLLDEATSALDNKSEKMVQETIDKLGGESSQALTTIEVAHRLSTVMHRDVIFVMQQGRVVEHGPHATLMGMKGVYHALVAAQQGAEQTMARADSTNDMLVPVPEAAGNEASDHRAPQVRKEPTVLDTDKVEAERQAGILKTYKAPMKRILGFCRPEWICAVPGTIGALLFGAKEPLLAWVLFEHVGLFYNPDRDQMYEDIVAKVWWFFVIAGGAWLGGILQFCSFGMMKEGLTMRMRCAAMQHLVRMEVGYHDDPEHTPAKNIFSLETYAFRAGNMMSGLGAYACVFGSLGVGLGLAFAMSWRMALMMLAMIPVMIFGKLMAIKMVTVGQGGSSAEELKTAQQVISDALNSIRTVRALGAEEVVVGLVGQWSTPVTHRAIKKAVSGGASYGFAVGLIFLVFAFAFWWASWLIRNDYNSFPEAMQAMGCILFGAMGMGQAVGLAGDVKKAKVACHDLFKLLDRPSLIDGIDPVGETPQGMVQEVGSIEFRDVRFFYPFRQDAKVLRGVSFSVTAGQSVGLCGPSGGGKTTILSLLQRFYDPQEGEILVTDRRLPLSSVNISWWREQMGYIGQEPVLFDATVRENVLYGLDPGAVSQADLERCGDMACLDFLKEQDGWETQVGPRGERLSGGQKQRVAICRAIVRDPRILLLDEATSALDSASEQLVQQALNNVVVARTSFTIAHRLSSIERCDVILVCAEGAVVESGSHAQLMAANGVYKKLQGASQKL